MLLHDQLLLSFNLFTSKVPSCRRKAVYTTYFIIAQRGQYLTINPFAVSDQLLRLIHTLRYIQSTNKFFNKWVLSFDPKFVSITRWLGWVTRASAYCKVSRRDALIVNAEQILSAKGYLATYTFINFVGIDIAFIVAPDRLSHRSALLTDRAIATIGVGTVDSSNYLFNLPGADSVRSVLFMSRFITVIFGKFL